MGRHPRAGSKLANARTRKAKSLKDVRHSSSSACRQETEIARLTRELNEAHEQQAATADVLKVISSSPGELEPVFQNLLDNATRLCVADFGLMFQYDGGSFQLMAQLGANREYVEYLQREPFRPGPETLTGRVLRARGPVQIEDFARSKGYLDRDPIVVVAVERGGIRTTMGVPMIRENELTGVICMFRKEVRLFTDKQVELLQNFAAQAVIAIENTRLLNELRQRTSDLTESLEQQTATSEVLKVISSSPGELEPVFEAILENASRICNARFGVLNLYDGEAFHTIALHNPPPQFLTRKGEIIHPHPESGLSYVARTKKIAHIDDIRTRQPYLEGDQTVVGLADRAGARTLLIVPLLKEGELIGAISIYRQEVRPFTDKEIDLVKNSAAQAVIAIENTRLLNELNKLNQQLEQRVADQVGEIERMGRLRRFLPPQVADLIVASGTEKQLESHRREITALFCDLRGFTGFSESSDPEDVMALLGDYHAAIGEIIIKYSGTLERYAGDGVMVVFNDPVPVENPALQAVLMALDMRTAIGALIKKWQQLGHDLGFGIGIAHWFATLGTI